MGTLLNSFGMAQFKSNSVASLVFLTLTKLYLVDFKADSSVACGPLRLDGEAWRRILQLDAEHRVGSRVRVLDLHVQVGQGGPIGHILRDGDLVMRLYSMVVLVRRIKRHLVFLLVERRWLVVDISDCDCYVCCRPR